MIIFKIPRCDIQLDLYSLALCGVRYVVCDIWFKPNHPALPITGHRIIDFSF